MSDFTSFAFTKIDSDLEFLISCFREVLEELGQPDLAAALPWDDIPSPESAPPRLGQAFSVAFQLLNLAEENAAEQTRRKREREIGMRHERGLWGEALQKLKRDDFTSRHIAEMLSQIRVEPVLTAHPTEAKRLTVLEQHRELFRALGERENPHLTPSELATIRRRVKAMLERLWRTGEILLAKPDVSDERRNVLHYLREIFPDALARLDSRLRAAWLDAGFHVEELEGHYPALRFGTWVGGDRDGHPLVTARVTRESLQELRLGAFIVLDRMLDRLAQKMSLSIYGQETPAILREAIAQTAAKIPAHAAKILENDEEEPWRQFARLIGARLPLDTQSDTPVLLEESGFYVRPDELRSDLDLLRESLESVGAFRLARNDLGPIYRALETFGFHLAALDVRQNSAFHDRALSQLMVAAGLDGADYPSWNEGARLRFLNEELKSPRPFLPPGAVLEGEAGAVLQCYRVLFEHLEKYGAEGVGALIISMTRSLSDLLTVFLLAREVGLTRMTPNGLVCALPVVPLFETVDDLEQGAGILQAFLEHPVARASLQWQARGARPTQQVMVGYSDSNKDKGIFASQWALQLGQSAMARVGAKTGVQIRFFHGRGGTISRGAGPTHRFLEALPHGSLSGNVRFTEQGETIAQKFGNRATATYNLELLLAGVASNTLRGQKPAPSHPLEHLAQKMAVSSGHAYRQFLETPGFMEFFRQATPIDALEHSRIGSRPSRRTGQATLADLRAIPWVFSWNQSRYFLPGWFGIGSGLKALQTDCPEEFQALKNAVSSWKFLRYVLTNVETNLASTDLGLMEKYAALVEDTQVRARFWSLISQEWQLTTSALDEIFGGSAQTRRPRMFKTLEVRHQALEVLHLQQIELLKSWRASGGDEKFLPELLLSINAIASGLRTTG